MTAASTRRILVALTAAFSAVVASHTAATPGTPARASPGSPAPREEPTIAFEPARPRGGDVVSVRIRGVAPAALVDVIVDGHPLGVFPTRDGHAALLGIDMDPPSGTLAWQLRATTNGAVVTAEGHLPIGERTYSVQHLTVDRRMVELDPQTERRAADESARLRTLYRARSGERLWRGRFIRPVAGEEPGTGFGARRVINGQPRAPHSGIDFAAPVGTPVVAANDGRVALTGEFFFPGRLVILDHGLGLYTVYFHLDTIAVTEGQLVARGERLGAVGMTGRVTGAHLHFGAQLGTARIDPAALLALAPPE